MAGFVQPISSQTLENMSDGGMLNSIAKGLVKGQEIKQQRDAAKQEQEIRQQQINEYKAGAELRNKQRQLSLANVSDEIKRLPQAQQNQYMQDLNTAKDLRLQNFDLVLSEGAQVGGAKSFRKWRDRNKDTLKDFFDDEDQYKQFMDEPYSVQKHTDMLRNWRSNKPAMIDKQLDFERELELSKAKESAKAANEGINTQTMDVTKQSAIYQETFGLEQPTADRLANITSDMHKSKQGRVNPDIIAEQAVKELEADKTAQGDFFTGQWGAKDYSYAQLQGAINTVLGKQQMQTTGTGLPATETTLGGVRNPIPIDKGADLSQFDDGTWVMVDGKPYQVKY